MALDFKITAKNLIEPGTNRRFSIVGSGNTLGRAQAEFNAKATLTVALTDDKTSFTVSSPYTAGGFTFNLGPTYSDADITLQRTAGQFNFINVHLENIGTTYSAGDGLILPGSPQAVDIETYATAFCDSQGNIGYVLRGGKYVR